MREGIDNPMFGRKQSIESKQQISKSLLGQNCDKHWFNNGMQEIFCNNDDKPKDYVLGRLTKKQKEEIALNKAIQLLYANKNSQP